MAGRQLKKGLMFFYNDVDFYRDIRIRKLIRRKNGQAATVYHRLLCEIYRNGYYLEWDDDLPFIISEDIGFQEDMILDVIHYCVELGLFSKDVFDKDRVLTSAAIQRCYFDAVKNAKRKIGSDLPYLLIDLFNDSRSRHDDTQLSIDFSENLPDNSEEKPISSEEIDINTKKIGKDSELMTQRKEKKSKDNNSLRSSLSSSSTSSFAHARGDLGFEKEEPITVKDAAVILLSDDSWLSSMGRRHKMSIDLVKKWYGSFVVECNCRGTQVHTGLSDVQKHFNDWLLKQSKTTSGQKDGNRKKKTLPSSSDDIIPEQVWNSCKEDLCLRVDDETRAKIFSKMTFMSFNKEDKRLLLQIPSDEVRKCVEGDQNLFSLFSSSLKTFFGQDMKLNYYLPPNKE